MNQIPDRFKPLFETDWNTGEDSIMTPLQRVEMNNLFLEYNNWCIIRPDLKETTEEEIIQGFIED